MKPLDKHFLSLQFKNNIHSKNGNEFQSFFEDIMEKAYLDFQKIRPYGNKGDGGNDGYRKDLGIYYQVYAPRVPKVNEKDAAGKLKGDFQKIKNEWNEISNIKTYNFVFNDKYDGSVQLLEEAITKLKVNNPNIEFRLFLARDLENAFFQLSDSDILDLGFNIDLRQAVENAYSYLEHVKNELDKENANFAQKVLENIKVIISELKDENLLLEYEILECRCLQKLEKIDEAKKIYENISKRYPEDPRPLLYLAEVCLSENNFDKNNEYLEKAEKINGDFWLLKLEQLLRKQNLGEGIDTSAINEKSFPEDPKIKANFYRLYGLLLENSGDQTNADRFLGKAIHLNPDRFNAHLDELSLVERRMLASIDASQRLHLSQVLLEGIESVTNRFAQYGDVGARNRLNLYAKKFNAFLVQDNVQGLESSAKEIFRLATTCYLDRQIEQVVAGIFKLVSLPDHELNQLLDYIKNSKKEITPNLAGAIIFQFNIRGTLITNGKKFFEEIGNQEYSEFIKDFENDNYEQVLEFLKNDIPLALILASTPIKSPGLRRKIIENLPADKNIQKEKLMLLLNFDEADFEDAFQILQQLDLSKLDYFECRPMLQVARQKEAWDFGILILEKLLEKEQNEKEIFNLKLELFTANFNLNKFPEAINIGEDLLKTNSNKNLLDPKNKEALLINTMIACFERGKVDEDAFKKAKWILEKYPLEHPSFEYKAGIEAEVYINNDEPEKALKSIVEGVKTKKSLSLQEYVKLYFVLSVKIGSRLSITLDSLDCVVDNTFIKLRNSDRWYYVGTDNELDALPISTTNNNYASFINKKVGGTVLFEGKYRSKIYEEQIELIFSIEKYILWQTVQGFHKLGEEGTLEGIDMIEIPEKGDTVDPQYLLKFMEDLHKRTEPLFELYCKNNVPLAILAISEGGLVGAIGRIQNEEQGYINFSVGTLDELEKQKEVARRVVEEGLQFYIDGTSALVLSEIGLLQKIYAYLPNLKVPQSVINLLAEIANRFKYVPGQTGDTMGYSKGKITISSIEEDKRELLHANFKSSVKFLESNPKNVEVISSANKLDCFSETKVPDDLSDACILAQRESLPALTEDFLYLKINELETKKKAPEYFSSWALVRVLYEKGYVTFDEYLEYFGYLSSYRFRFLSVTSDDIEKAVFGDGEVKIFKPENIRRLNFPLTLSEEYGVPFQDALRVIGIFFFRAMMDTTVALDTVEKIFVEIIESFPTKMSKKEFGERLLGVCITVFESNTPKNLCRLADKLKYQKIEKLLHAIESFSEESKLVTPN